MGKRTKRRIGLGARLAGKIPPRLRMKFEKALSDVVSDIPNSREEKSVMPAADARALTSAGALAAFSYRDTKRVGLTCGEVFSKVSEKSNGRRPPKKRKRGR